MERIVCLLVGYLCGNIESGYFYGKKQGIDIRDYGSHSTGATNVLRVLGLKAGLTVFLSDFLKGFIPCMIVRYLFRGTPDRMFLMIMWTACGAALGHDFPFWLHFRGGKGISASAGVMMAVDPVITLICMAFFVLVVALSRFVSLGSILAMVLLAVLLVAGCLTGRFGGDAAFRTEFTVLSILIPGLAVYRHRSNIGRLLAGKENKLNLKTKGSRT